MTNLEQWRLAAYFAILASTAVVQPGFAEQEKSKDPKESSRMTHSRRYQRERWFYQQREYPLGRIPENSRLRALQQIERSSVQSPNLKPAAATQPVQGNNWVNIGPAPIEGGQIAPPQPVSGRVTAIAVDPLDPTHWLAGAAQGGVWETRDAGGTWAPLTDSQASLAMGAIAFAPSNPNIIYAGTGEANFSGDSYGGLGLLKSTDGGLTWQLLATNNFAKNSFSDIKVHPADPNTVVAAIAEGLFGRGADFPPSPPSPGMYKSTDGGLTWSLRLAGLATDLEVDPSNFGHQYAGLFRVGVSRSLDGGNTWTTINGPWGNSAATIGRVELAVSPSNPSTLYVSVSDFSTIATTDGQLGIWRTDNAWDALPAWRQIPNIPSSNVGQLSYNHDILVDQTNPDIFYFGEIAVWKFNGAFWTALAGDYDPNVDGKLIHPDQHALAWAGNRLIIGNDGGVWSTKDAGVSFNNHNTTLAITQFYDGSLHPTNADFALGGSQDNGTEVWRGSNSWEFVFGGDGAANAFSTTKPDIDWAVSFYNLAIYRTLDGGVTFNPADSGIDHSTAPFISRFEKCPANEDVFIAGTDVIWKCTNFFSGATPTWYTNSPSLSAGISGLGYAASDTNGATYAYGTDNGHLRLTSDGGATWVDIDAANKVPNRYVTDLAFDPTNANVLYVTLSGFDEGTPGQPGHLFKTTNALAASPVWSNVSPPVNLPNNTIVLDPSDPNIVYVGADIGVWKSTDGASTWTHMGPSVGMPNVAVFELQINAATSRLVAFTHGRGAFVLGATVAKVTDLAVTLTDAPDPTFPGQNLVYTAAVTNQGPLAATGVTLVDNLPVGLNFVSVMSSQGASSQSGRRITCALGSLAAGASATVSLVVSPTTPEIIANTVAVSANETDNNLANNTATAFTTVNAPSTDLSITAIGSPNPAVIGRNLTYTLAITCQGPAPASGVTVTDLLPQGVTVFSVSSSQGACGQAGGTVNCALGTMAVGASAQITIVVIPPAVGTITNVATVSSSAGDINPANNTSTLVTTVAYPAPIIIPAGARLISESFSPPSGGIDAGETVTVNFLLQNVGTADSSNLVATLKPTGGVTSPSGPQAYGVLTVTGPPVAGQFSFTATGTNGGSITATLQLQDGTNNLGAVTFTYGLGGTFSYANQSVLNIPDSGPAGLYPSPIFVSGIIGLAGKVTVTISNITHTFPDDIDVLLVGPTGRNSLLMSDTGGGNPLNNVTLTFDDAASAQLPDSDPITSGTYQPTDYETGDTFPPPAPAGLYPAALSTFNGTDPNGTWALYVVDDTPGDAGRIAGGWALTIITVDPVDPVADVAVSINDSPDPIMIGSNLTYTIMVTNSGPKTATGVMLTNLLPASATFVSATNLQGGACSNFGNMVVCNLGTLTNQGRAFVTILAMPTSSGPITNLAAVSANEVDRNSLNNTASAVTTVSPAADLAVGLAASPNPATIGNNFTYTVTVTNNGPDNASGVSLTNTLPAGVTFISASASQGGCSQAGGVVNCSLGGLPKFSIAIITIVVRPPAVGSLTNTARVSATQPTDLIPGNNTASIITSAINPALIILPAGATLTSESFSPPSGGIEAGETVTISLGLTNAGISNTTALVAALRSSGGVGAPSGPQNYGVITGGGAVVFRPFNFTASGASGGIITATLDLQDGTNNLGVANFNFILGAVTTWANSGVISILDDAHALPYPSSIVVSNLTGVVAKVTVTLSNVTHTFPDDIDILLTGPAGRAMVLMSDAGGGNTVSGVTLNFDDAATAALPDSTPILPGAYKPTDYEVGDPFPTPAPPGPYGATLSVFNGGNPNGTWSLFVVDDALGDAGRIDGGWSLAITTVGRINPPPVRLSAPPQVSLAGFLFTIHGEVGDTFVIEASADIAGGWTQIATVTLTGVSLDFQDPDSATYGRRFYRARRP